MHYNGDLIKDELLQRHMTINDFARAAEISQKTARFVVKGGRATQLRTIGKVATALGIDPPSRVLLDDEEAVM